MSLHDLPRARCWLEVDTSAIVHNLSLARGLLGDGVSLIAVLKADAYGLGLESIGQLLWRQGVRRYAVACLEEAFRLREALPQAWILCMGETLDGALEQAVAAEIRFTVGALDSALRLSDASQRAAKPAYVHFKADTGLHRIGLMPDRAADVIRRCLALRGICGEGLYTHLALHNAPADAAQHAALQSVVSALGADCPPFVHVLDSIGLTRYPAWQHSAVRVGALLYGNAPRGFDRAGEVRPTVRFLCRVARVERVPAGEYIGYDDSVPLARDTLVATLSAGYADGYPRVFSRVGSVHIGGRPARCLGLICMDQMMVDVTDLPEVRPGQEAVLLGDGISLTDYAALGRLNRNECTAVIGKRVPRIYI